MERGTIMRKNNRQLKSYISWVLLFVLVFTCTATPCTVAKASEIKEDTSSVVEFNGHKYMYYQGGISWYKAKEECEEKGGYLVVISSQEEQDFLNEYIKDLQKNKLLTKQDIWIGASISNGVMSWVKDESNNYVNWASGEPNNVFNKQDCVMMYTTLSENGTLGKWNDENGNGRDWSGYELWNIGYICEWDENQSKEDSADVVEFNGHKYIYYQGGISWYKAKEECEKKGGHLVVISSQEEQEFLNEYIVELVKSGQLKKPNIWIGAKMQNSKINWVVNENNNIYTNWQSGEPNNYGSIEDCVMMYTSLAWQKPVGKWNDECGNGRSYEDAYAIGTFGYICEWDEEPSTYSIRMLSYLPTMVIGKGDSCGAGVQLEKGGSIVKDGASFSIVSSDTNVVSISNICEELDGTFFSINGEGEGKAVITVSEHLSGAKYSTVVQVNKGIYTYNADALPKYYDRENECNGYIDGMYIDEFTIKSKSAAGRVVSFNVYNTTCACGAVDVYNGDGKIIKSEFIYRSSNCYVNIIKYN